MVQWQYFLKVLPESLVADVTCCKICLLFPTGVTETLIKTSLIMPEQIFLINITCGSFRSLCWGEGLYFLIYKVCWEKI
jgi:hypothetical protein